MTTSNNPTNLFSRLIIVCILLWLSLSHPSPTTASTGANQTNICTQVGSISDEMRRQCEVCLKGPDDNPQEIEDNGFWTAAGCINVGKTSTLTRDFVLIGISLAGGAALLLILYGAFTMTTSMGKPDQLQKGQETITSAIAGLVFIILSVVLLNFIGLEILRIPGL